MKSNIIRTTALFAAYVSFSTPAYAYLDPATGSIVLQALVGIAASWVMYSKLFASKAKGLLLRLTGKSPKPDSE